MGDMAKYGALLRDVRCRVVSNEFLSPSVRRLECRAEEAFDARIGQFALVFPPRDSLLLGRAFAVAECTKDSFAFWYALKGKGTQALSGLKPGDEVRARGPLGNAFPKPEDGTRVFVVAGGIGAAALALARSTRGEVHLGVPDMSWKPLAERFSGSRVFSEDGSLGEKGNALSGLPEKLTDGDRIWACGPNPMLKALTRKYKDRLSQLYFSLEARMACGYGGCFGCVVDTVHGKKRVCADGPVFRADEVIWDAI